MNWLPDMDLNHDKQIQSLLCYRYTIGQAGACDRLKDFISQSSCQTIVPQGQKIIARGFNRGLPCKKNQKPRRDGRKITSAFGRPFGTRHSFKFYPRLKPRATINRPNGASN